MRSSCLGLLLISLLCRFREVEETLRSRCVRGVIQIGDWCCCGVMTYSRTQRQVLGCSQKLKAVREVRGHDDGATNG